MLDWLAAVLRNGSSRALDELDDLREQNEAARVEREVGRDEAALHGAAQRPEMHTKCISGLLQGEEFFGWVGRAGAGAAGEDGGVGAREVR